MLLKTFFLSLYFATHQWVILWNIYIWYLRYLYIQKQFSFFNINLFIYLWLCWVFIAAWGLSLVAVSGATLHCGAQASRCGGFSCCGARALGMRASVVVHVGLVAAQHVGSSWTRARTRVPCIGRQIFNHCTTREAQKVFLKFNSVIDE